MKSKILFPTKAAYIFAQTLIFKVSQARVKSFSYKILQILDLDMETKLPRVPIKND